MNSHQPDLQSNSIRDRVHTADPRDLLSQEIEETQKGTGLSSTPSDTDWVSPFTLPPLPAPRRVGNSNRLLNSPEHPRQREGSGAYYAAAWGSPYASPSPEAWPKARQLARRSIDSELSSPSHLQNPSHSHKERGARHSVDSSEFASPEGRKKVVRKRRVKRDRSEKPNWLSDSAQSSSAESAEEEEPTPTRKRVLFSSSASPGKVPWVSGLVSHHNTESVDTVTPDTFRSLSSARQRFVARNFESLNRAMAEEDLIEPTMDVLSDEVKPLPELPRRTSYEAETQPKDESPASPSRPRLGSVQSFQRPKKKVVWKGKNCTIALPLTDRESAGLPPLLTSQELKAKLEQLRAQGFSTVGFELTDELDDLSVQGSGQSKPLFPDPVDLQSERKMRQFAVHIPNQAEWEAWVQYLQEEKLRALGVTPSNSEPTASVTSPLSSQSRNSSRYPGGMTSPPAVSSSAASNPLRATSNPFSPAFSTSSGFGSHIGSGASSHNNSFPAPVPAYKQSAVPISHGVPPSAFGNLSPQPGPDALSSGTRSPVDPGRRAVGFPPINAQGMQSLGEVLSPNMDSTGQQYNGQDLTLPGQPLPLSPGVISPRPSSHEPKHTNLSPPPLPKQSFSLPRTPNADHLSRPPIEIQQPTPRSHRHNLSEALQREIDDAEAELERIDGRNVHQSHQIPEQKPVLEQNEEDAQDELPILKRPETLGGMDDKSDIETNPSIAASPLLMEDKNPFSMANWQALSDAAKGYTASSAPKMVSYKGHGAHPSLSKLNVQAKEFDPKAGFSSSNFTFGNGAFQTIAAPVRPPKSLVKRDSAVRVVSGTRLNVEAPSFVPGGAAKPALPEVSHFKFEFANLNADAPEFDPNRPPTENFQPIHQSETDQPKDKIFGDVKIDPDSKVSRRSNKALPITRPRSKQGSSSSSSSVSSVSEAEDDEGRPTAPIDRNKRAKTWDSDGEKSPTFADSAPFANLRFIDEEEVKELVDDEPEHKIKEKPVDGWSYIPADEASLAASHPRSPSITSPSELPERSSPFTFREDDEAVKFSEARPRSLSPPAVTDVSPDPAPTADSEAEFEPLAGLSISPRKEKEREAAQKPQTSLSALAEPFVARSVQPSNKGQNTTHNHSELVEEPFRPSQPSRKSVGLESSKFAQPGLQSSRWARSATPPRGSEASRFATSPTPPTSPPPEAAERLPSPNVQSEISVKYGDEHLRESTSTSQHVVDVSPVSDMAEADFDQNRHSSIPHHKYSISRSISDHDSPPPELLNSSAPDLAYGDEDLMPSFEEIDAVMKQFETNPELGIERNDSPIQSTPLVDMRLGSNFRSDAPSPSPRRQQPQHDAASAATHGLGLGIHKLNSGNEQVSEWDDAISSTEENKLQSRAQFFDGHVNDLVDGILENRLGPLERTLQTIQHSISLIATRPGGRRSMSTDFKESDADDEDEPNAGENFQSYRTRSPESKRNRKTSRIRAAVAEGMAAYKQRMPETQPAIDLSQVMTEIAELRQAVQQTPKADSEPHKDLKTTLEDVISSHPRLRGSRVQQDHEPAESKYRLHLDGLEAMLKAEQQRADHESRLRRKADEEIELLKMQLKQTEDEAAEHREASEEAQKSLTAFVQEKAAYHQLEQDFEDLNLKNDALEKTLDEYRRSKTEWEDNLVAERKKTEQLDSTLHDVQEQLEERSHGARNLRLKVERLQHQMTGAMQDLNSEQAGWRQREHELMTKMSIIENALDQATRQREKAEVDYNFISRQYKDALLFKDRFEGMQQEAAKSQEIIAALRQESKTHEDQAFRFEKELGHAREVKEAEVGTATARLQAELESTKTQLESFKSDSQAQVARLQSRLDSAELDLEEQKANHDNTMTETVDSHKQALQEVTEKHEANFEEQHAAHERKLADLRDRHTRAMHNSSDDRHRLEHQYNEKLNLNEDKVKHLEGKISDLEDRLEITRSAARAAVEAATAKGVNLPTPASSVVASPPQRISSASMPAGKVSELPEKIPVQSLRESIMVLQEQLQNREQKIEELVAEIRTIDRDAPQKNKELETEVTWLRELLAVRVDDLEDIVSSLSQPDFNRDTIKDAAIRLKANIQMEQQIREKAASVAGLSASLPTISTLSSYAQSPRTALPLVASAAWGNFQKAKNYGSSALSELAQNYGNQTPSKSTTGSPASWVSGIMTPPNTTVRTPMANDSTSMPPPMRPLAAAAAARKAAGGSEARPLRAFNSQPRALNSRQQPKIDTTEVSTRRSSSPHTPTMTKRDMVEDFSHDVDDDASPLDGRESRRLESVEPVTEE